MSYDHNLVEKQEATIAWFEATVRKDRMCLGGFAEALFMSALRVEEIATVRSTYGQAVG